MEFLVGFDVTVRDGTPGSEVEERLSADAPGQSKAVGLYRAQPNDPARPRPSVFRLPDPRPTPVHRLEATLGEPVDLGDTGLGHRRVVPLTGGTATGPTITGKLLVYETYLVQ
jgi:hypothetical protein